MGDREYEVVETNATDPADLQNWLNGKADEGWRCVSITAMPASEIDVKVGGGLFNPDYDRARGFVTHANRVNKHAYNVWVVLERELG